MTTIDRIFVQKLKERGIEEALIPGFMRSLVNAFLINPEMSLLQANRRLEYLGWHDIEIDLRTLELAVESLKVRGLSRLEYKPAPWYIESYETDTPAVP